MINERLRKRLRKDRLSTTITVRIPADIRESLESTASARGVRSYQTLLRSYISDGLRRDEAEIAPQTDTMGQRFARQSVPKMTEKQLIARDSKRVFATELLQAVREMKAGKAARVHHVKVPEVVEARARTGFTQQQFAAVLGVSRRTLEGWEQGRRNKPNGAARSLLTIARKRPDVFRELFAD
jgi:putative transcriptional regulator